MVDEGSNKDPLYTCVFWHPERALRCVVRGDDFTVLGWEEELDWLWARIGEEFLSKHRRRLGPTNSDRKEIRILNMLIS